jgi:hypothetical protein
MPLWDNNELDDQPVFDLSTDFRGGMNSTVLPHLLLPNQYAVGYNVVLTDTGRIRTRGGLKARMATSGDPVSGICYYETTAKELILMATDDGTTETLKAWNNSSEATIVGYTLEGRVSAFQGGDNAYFFGDGGSEYYNGTTLYNNGVGEIATITFAGTGYVVGELLTLTGGTYEVQTIMRVAAVDGSGGITEVDFGSGAVVGEGYSVAPAGFTTSASGTGATFTYQITEPPQGNIACWHTERVFKNNVNAPDSLEISDILVPQRFPVSNRLTIGSDGEPITGLHSWDNRNIVVFKTNSVYVIDCVGASPANWTIQKVSSIIGCVSHWTTTQVGFDVWWLSREGVQSLRRLFQETQREITDTISAPVHNYIAQINWTIAAKASMEFYDNKVFLAFPSNLAAENDTWLIYDTYHKVWVSEWCDAAPPNLMIRSRFGNEPGFYVGTPQGELREYEDASKVDTDITLTESDIGSYVTLRSFSFNDPISDKDLLNIQLEFTNSDALIDVWLSINDMNFVQIADDIRSEIDPLTIPFTIPAVLSSGGQFKRAFNLLKYRGVSTVQVKLQTSANRMSIRSVTLSAFLRNMRIEF